MAGRYDVRDKVVLITGASRGIGADAARRLAKRGAKVSLVGLEPELLEQVATEIGADTAWFEADVTDWDALGRAVDATVARFGGIDVAVANAGIAPFGTVATIDPDAFERTIEVNLLGVWRTVRTALPHVVARQGYILSIASLAAALHPPMLAHYAATKAGVEAFCDSLRAEIAHTGTRVGVAYFSFIDTDMVREGLDSPSANVLRDATPGPFSKTAPLSAAGKAIERGVTRRADKVWAPRWVLPRHGCAASSSRFRSAVTGSRSRRRSGSRRQRPPSRHGTNRPWRRNAASSPLPHVGGQLA